MSQTSNVITSATTNTPTRASSRAKARSHLAAITGLAPRERILRLREGLPAESVAALADEMGWTKEHAIETLKISRSTLNSKIRAGRPLDTSDSERLLAVMDMIEQVRQMVERSGDPTGFDASKWLAAWIDTPNPALGGLPPSDYLDTHEGVQVVRRLLAQMESGAYA